MTVNPILFSAVFGAIITVLFYYAIRGVSPRFFYMHPFLTRVAVIIGTITMRWFLALGGCFLVLLVLAGCAAWPSGSYEDPTIAAAEVAPAIAGYVARHAPASVKVVPASGDSGTAHAVEEALIKDGVAVNEVGEPVRYVIAPLIDGVMVRVVLGEKTGAQIFGRGPNGRLIAAGPMMERN